MQVRLRAAVPPRLPRAGCKQRELSSKHVNRQKTTVKVRSLTEGQYLTTTELRLRACVQS
jgi:hypothetical protein